MKSLKAPCNHKWLPFFACQKFSLEKCGACQIIRTISSKKTLRQYQDDDIENAFKQYWLRGNEYPGFARAFLDYLPASAKKGRLLDVGCGLGWVVAEANRRGFKAWGVDPSKGMVSYGKKKVTPNLIASPLQRYHPKTKFDYVTLSHCLEHIEDLSGFLQKIRSLLNQKGKILVATPNINSLMFQLFKCRWYPMLYTEHYWQFTPKTLATVISSEGFTIKKITVTNVSYNPPNVFKKVAFFVLNAAANLFGYGDQVIIYAQKNRR